MTLAVRCGRSSILRQNLDKFFKHNNKCGMGPHVWPLGTYHVKYAPITFKYQHFRLFFLKKEKNSQNARSGVQGHPLHLLSLLQWVWWLTLVKQNRPFTKWLLLQIGTVGKSIKSSRKAKYLEFRRLRRHLLKYEFCKKLLQYKWTSDQLNIFPHCQKVRKKCSTGQKFICTKVTSLELVSTLG